MEENSKSCGCEANCCASQHARVLFLPKNEIRALNVARALRTAGIPDLGAHLLLPAWKADPLANSMLPLRAIPSLNDLFIRDNL
jgi:hypothetical protein